MQEDLSQSTHLVCQLTVDAARATSTRIGSSFSISGSNVATTDGTTAGTVSAGTITAGVYAPGTISAVQGTTMNLRSRLVSHITFKVMQFPLLLLL